MRRTLGLACRKLVKAKSDAVLRLRNERELNLTRRDLRAASEEAVATAVRNGARVHPRVAVLKGYRS